MSAGPAPALSRIHGVWALMPEQLLELQAIYDRHLRGEKVDIKALEAQLGRPLANQQRAYEVTNGVAVLRVEGVLFPKANLFSQISGGASAQLLTRQVEAAGVDSAVRSMVLCVDSPGGSVLGTPELAAALRRFAAAKPLVAHSDGVLASAAYWVASAANAIFVSGPTVVVGSIGVVATHRDSSAAQAQAGIKTTEIAAGRYKRLASANEPLSVDGRASLQAQVDYLYRLFVDAVAANRGTSVDAVLEHMADGRMFIGQQAIDAGLVDGFSTLNALVNALAKDPAAFATRRKASTPTRAPGSAPASAPAAPTPPRKTRAEMQTETLAYAKARGATAAAAWKALGFDAPGFRSHEQAQAEIMSQAKAERVAMAHEYAQAHGVGFVTALKALGLAH